MQKGCKCVCGRGGSHLLLSLTIDHASPSRRSTLPTPDTYIFNIGALSMIFPYTVLHESSCL